VKSRIAAATRRRYGTAVELSGELPGLDALAALNERSVCRRYRGDPVPEEVVRLLCATALAAPTKSDLQQATIVRLADPAKRAALPKPAPPAAATPAAATPVAAGACPPGSQGHLFGVGGCVVPGDRDYNRGSLSGKGR